MRISDWSSDVCSSDLSKSAGSARLALFQLHHVARREILGAENRSAGIVSSSVAIKWGRKMAVRQGFAARLMVATTIGGGVLLSPATVFAAADAQADVLPTLAVPQAPPATPAVPADDRPVLLEEVIVTARKDRKSNSLNSSHQCASRMTSAD